MDRPKGYGARIDSVIGDCGYNLLYDRQDWFRLAMACLDQAMVSKATQDRIKKLLPEFDEEV